MFLMGWRTISFIRFLFKAVLQSIVKAASRKIPKDIRIDSSAANIQDNFVFTILKT